MQISRTFRWLLCLLLPLHFAEGADDFDPSKYKWKKRPVIVYAPDDATELLTRQRSLWSGEAGRMGERDIELIVWKGRDALPGKARQRYEIDPEKFTVLLIGKDGGVKLREHAPVGPKRIHALIDSMPMRQEEMRRD